jgi:alanyl aminopeptidase
MKWLSGKNAPQLGSMLRSILQTAAYSGDQAVFDAMVEAAAGSRDSGERHEIFTALGSFSDAGLRQRAFEQVLSGKFDVREASAIFYVAADRTDSAPALLRFLRSHYDALLAKLPEDSRASVPRWGRALCSAQDRASFQDFFKTRAAKHPGGARNLAQALESIDICVASRNIQEPGVQRLLFAQKGQPTMN